MTTTNELLRYLPGRMAWAFEALDVCTDTVTATGLEHDKSLSLVWLAPPVALRGLAMGLYRAHVAELCERWKAPGSKPKRRRSLDNLTRAEVFAGLYQASLAAPLNPSGAAMYSALFREMLPEHAELASDVGRERYDGETEESIAAAQRQTVSRE